MIETKSYFLKLGAKEIKLPIAIEVIRRNQADRRQITECEDQLAANIKETRT